jgi:hypothetical protein
MGQSSSSEALICSYNKTSFNEKLDLIRDAHDVSQFYAKLILQNRVPEKINEFKNYSDKTQDYFNITRKEILPDLDMSYYKFYEYLVTIPILYDKYGVTDNDRHKLLTDVFNKCYIVQKYLIEDLWDDCNGQGNIMVPSQEEVDEISIE